MTIDKHGNKWRVRQMVDGHTYCITLDHKPSKVEAMALLSDRIKKAPQAPTDMTFRMACSAYIDAKANILSPKTVKEYTETARRLPDAFCERRLTAITYIDVQKLTNDLSARLNPKTVGNYINFVMAVLKAQDIDIKKPKLPQRIKSTPYIPTDEDLKAVMSEIIGTEHEVPIMLCCFGLRRSEVCALTLADLNGDTLTINKAMVKDKDNNWIIKTTKTTESTRTVVIPSELADMIRAKGYIYKYNPENIYKALQRAQDRAGVHRFRLHDLRHFFASYLHLKGFPDKQIQEMGGWKTDHVMKAVYQHAMELDKAKAKAASDIGSLFDD